MNHRPQSQSKDRRETYNGIVREYSTEVGRQKAETAGNSSKTLESSPGVALPLTLSNFRSRNYVRFHYGNSGDAISKRDENLLEPYFHPRRIA